MDVSEKTSQYTSEKEDTIEKQEFGKTEANNGGWTGSQTFDEKQKDQLVRDDLESEAHPDYKAYVYKLIGIQETIGQSPSSV